MPASQPHPHPQPLPLPPPPLSLPSPSSSSTSPSTVPRRRHHHHRRLASSSSSSSSSASIFSSSPSPSRRFLAAAAVRDTTASSVLVVPFSWELHPGIPKNCLTSSAAAAAGSEPLPLPPPLRSSPRRRLQHRRRRSDGVPAAASSTGSGTSDPFTAAFAECTREEEDGAKDNFRPVASTRTVSGRRSDASEHRWWLSGGNGLVGFLDLYGCKSAMAVADAAFLARRRPAVARTKQGRATRRDK